ncbi:MAG TPA: DUF2147 domain-containing protein [Rectinemataceae bacterium]|nr:DUF2147 domain-containing protein [Rectinemataceae bacterium]
MASPRGFAILALMVIGSVGVFAQDIVGLWKQLDDKSGKPQSIVCIYGYQGRLFGRMIAAYDDATGKIKDTIYIRKDKADKLVGDPPFCGLDFVYNVVEKGSSFRGSIMDPRNGDEYDCNIKRNGTRLVVRGQLKGLLGFLGRNQTWVATTAADPDLPPGFVMPDPSSFVPVLPRKK